MTALTLERFSMLVRTAAKHETDEPPNLGWAADLLGKALRIAPTDPIRVMVTGWRTMLLRGERAGIKVDEVVPRSAATPEPMVEQPVAVEAAPVVDAEPATAIEVAEPAAELVVLEPQRVFVAKTAGELATAQHGMIAWCRARIEAEEAELNDAMENHRIALERHWATEPWERRINRHDKKVQFFQKILGALEAGLVLVPNFDIDVFAVRVKAKKAPVKAGRDDFRVSQVDPKMLPAGVGRYVDDQTKVRNIGTHKEKNSYGGEDKITTWQSADFQSIDFPVDVANPVILEQVGNAMDLKVFDEIGIARNQDRLRSSGRGDPILIGRVRNPSHRFAKPVSFFLGWYFDVRTLG